VKDEDRLYVPQMFSAEGEDEVVQIFNGSRDYTMSGNGGKEEGRKVKQR
jgi:hypothetical protein